MQESETRPVGPLLRFHQWLTTPPFEIDEERYQLVVVATWAMSIGLLAHVAYGLLFSFLGIWPLAAFNVLSVLVFVQAVRFARQARVDASLALASSEVAVHALAATVVLGWDTGFHYPMLLALVLWTIFSTLPMGDRILGGGSLGATYLLLAVYAQTFPPWRVLDPVSVRGLTVLNVVVFLVVLSGICLYYVYTVQLTRAARDAAEDELRSSLATAQELERMKTDFASTVSHELRTPLTSILGFTKVVRSRLDERVFPKLQTDEKRVLRAVDQVRGNLDIVITEGERLTALINNVLDIAKMESGEMEYVREDIEPGAIVKRAANACSGLFTSAEVVLDTDVQDAMPTFVGDPDRIQQVLVNLVSNAVKFTHRGWVRIAAEGAPAGIRFSVRDTGVGIQPKDLPKVFEKFQQVGTLDNRPAGSGLGLAICRQIVEAHGGEIWVDSEVGEGTTVYFLVPIDGRPSET